MQYLAEAREQSAGKPLSTKDILRALILPIGEEIAKSTHTRQTLAQLVARTFTEPAKFIQTMHRKFFGELCEKFMDELRKTHPQVEREGFVLEFTPCRFIHAGSSCSASKAERFFQGYM